MDDEELKGLLPAQEPVEEARVEEGAPPPAEAEAPAEGPARDAAGKFVSKAVEPGHVPVTALMDERDKRQALERQIAEFKARETPPAPPTRDEQLEAALYSQNLRSSRRFAEREYGKDVIATVHDWAAARCDADPHFNSQMRSSDDPYEAAFQAYNREQIVSKVTPDRLAAFEAWEQAQAELQAANPSPQPSAPRPPTSLANVPGTGARGKPSGEEGEGAAFNALFP